MTQVVRTRVRFGVFEVDFVSGELRKRGIKIPLQAQPLQVLRILLERPGEVVTRQELRERLWPADTFVDFEHSLNSSVKKVRQALGDSSDNPRFVETLARRGYRFIAPVLDLPIEQTKEAEPSPPAVVATQEAPAQVRKAHPEGHRRRSAAFTGGGLLFLLFALYWLFPAHAPSAAHLTQITRSVAVEPWGDLVTDGARLYFLEHERDHWNLVQTSTSGGSVERFPAPFPNTKILDVSPDRSELIVTSFVLRQTDTPLWIMPAQGGTPRRLGDVSARVACWIPGKHQILYGREQGLFIVNDDGTAPRKFLGLPGLPISVSWSPDGRLLRYSVDDGYGRRGLWEVSADGSLPHRIFSDPNNLRGDCCGHFSPDGKFFLFSSWRGEVEEIWAVREGADFPRRVRRQPVALTHGPGQFWDPVPSRDGKRFFLFGWLPGKDEVSRYEIKSKLFVPFIPEVQAIGVAYSRDGEWIAYAVGPDSTIWRSRPDGSERRQLTFPTLHAHRPSWSADGSRIAFQGEISAGTPRIYTVSSDGGDPRPLTAWQEAQTFPDWSPDGGTVAYSAEGPRADGSESAIMLFDWKTGRAARLSGSEGKIYPKWSPDQRHIAALSEDLKELTVFDVRAAAWSEAATGVSLTGLNWSSDGASLYFQDRLGPGEPIYRFTLRDRKRERLVDFRELTVGGIFRCGFAGLTPEGDPLVMLNRSHPDIYALDLE